MTHWCRIAVLFVIGFYAVAGGWIPSPLAATGSNCVTVSSGSNDCPPGCDGGCPPSMCIVSPYAAPAAAPVLTERSFRYVSYAPAPVERLTPHTPAPAFRPPNA